MIKCSLCPQEFDENDSLIEERKKKHEAKHLRYVMPSQRDGHLTKNSSTKGKVEWLQI